MADTFDALPVGYTMGGYEITRVIGAGGFGITYEGLNPITERRVAIKEFFPAGLARRDATSQVIYSQARTDVIGWALEKFKSTTTALCRLDHPNILRVHDYWPANGTGYMLMELLDGQTLEGWLRAQEPHRPSPQELRPVLEPVLDALAYVHHKGLVHRDIAPDNIVLTRQGRPVLIDFGALSRDVSKATQLAGTVGIAKAHYTAPEQARRDARPEPASDIYSLGAVLYRALAGEVPEDGPHRLAEVGLGSDDPYRPLSGRPGIDPGVAAAVDAALALRRAERPQTVADLARGLGWGPVGGAMMAAPGPAGPEPAVPVVPVPLPVAPVPAADPIVVTPIAPLPRAAPDPIASGPPHGPAGGSSAPDRSFASLGPPIPAVELTPPPPAPPLPPAEHPPDPPSWSDAPRPKSRRSLLAAGGAAVLLAAGGALLLRRPPDPDQGAAQEDGAGAATSTGSAPARVVTFSNESVYAVAFSSNGRFAVSGGSDKAAKLWDLSTGALTRSFGRFTENLRAVGLFSDQLVAACQDAAAATIWDGPTGAVRATISVGPSGGIQRLLFSPDGRSLLAAATQAAKLFDVSSGRMLRELASSSLVYGAAFTPDGAGIVGGDLHGNVRLWDVRSGQVRSQTTIPGQEAVQALALSPNGRQVLVGRDGSSGNLALYDLDGWKLVRRYDGHPSNVRAVAFSPDGAVAASHGWDSPIRIWVVASGREVSRAGPQVVYASLAFAGDRAVLAQEDGGILRWTLEGLPGSRL